MSRIVFFGFPAHGHTNPTLGVVRALTARGHQVLYFSYEMFREQIEAAGAVFVPCDQYNRELHLTPGDAARLGSDLAFSIKILVDTTLALDDMVCPAVEQLKPDCIVADSMAVWGKAVAAKLGIPFVSSTTTFAFNQHSAKIMKQSPGGLLSMLFSMPKVSREVRRLQKKGYPVKSFLDLIKNDDQTHTIVYTSPAFQPCSETFSDRYAFVGPAVRPPAERIQKTRESLVYISMGTVNNEMRPLYERCITALKEMPVQAILSVGDRMEPGLFGQLPEEIRVHRRVDQIAVLEQADVFLSHCGMNSVSESLYYGVPLVMLPQTPEQRGVAEQVRQLGAGVLLEKTDAESIRDALERVLREPSYRSAARKISEDFRRCGGAEAAADKILSLCGDRKAAGDHN